MHGNTLYLIESAKEPLPGYIKTSKELILPKEIYHTLTKSSSPNYLSFF